MLIQFKDEQENLESIDDLKSLIEYSLFVINEIRNYAKANNCLNEQFYIDWENELNRISVLPPDE